MAHQVSMSEADIAGKACDDGLREIAPDLAYKRMLFANVAFFGIPGSREWVLIDAGVPGMASRIKQAAKDRFGDTPPQAVILTHAHFDHVGSLETLCREWDVPVFAHALECPYLDGSAAYPKADPGVGGGIMSLLSPLYPRGPINIKMRLRELPEDGTVPAMPGWRAVHTPGHSVGHVSLWRDTDRILIAGDAFITTNAESAYASALQEPEIHGPPQYFTHNWVAARASVKKLAIMEPEIVVSGHGRAMKGAAMRNALHRLASEFDTIAKPNHGAFINHPCRAADGSAYIRSHG
jgi:glyoxylase-like metal-dependent hydrolase (beta-lactamase superfamily II)